MPDAPASLLPILLTGAVALALVGFLVGVGTPPEVPWPLGHAESQVTSAVGVPTAPTYRALRDAPWATGEGWTADTEALRGPSPLDPVALEGTDKAAALATRQARRAFDGAPPTIPHAVRQDGAGECLACHDAGLRIRGRLASGLPHNTAISCTQCHVVQQAPMPGAMLPPDATFAQNSFVGVSSPEQGARAWSIAPPVIPHRSAMRERCTGCHGPNGKDALRSSHPEQQNCTQCHAMGADMDLRPALGVEGQP